MADPVADKLAREASAAKGLIADLRGDGFDEDTQHDMAEGETSIMEAIDAAIAEMDECAAIVAGCKAQAEVYNSRASKFSARADRIRGLIEQAMVIADLATVKRPTATISVKKTPPKPMVTDESLIPSQFFKPQPPKLDKAAINDAIKAGETVAGVQLDNGGISLQIRRV